MSHLSGNVSPRPRRCLVWSCPTGFFPWIGGKALHPKGNTAAGHGYPPRPDGQLAHGTCYAGFGWGCSPCWLESNDAECHHKAGLPNPGVQMKGSSEKMFRRQRFLKVNEIMKKKKRRRRRKKEKKKKKKKKMMMMMMTMTTMMTRRRMVILGLLENSQNIHHLLEYPLWRRGPSSPPHLAHCNE